MKPLGQLLSEAYTRCVNFLTRNKDTSVVVNTTGQNPGQENRKWRYRPLRLGLTVLLFCLLFLRTCHTKPKDSLPGGHNVQVEDKSKPVDRTLHGPVVGHSSPRTAPYTPPEGRINLESKVPGKSVNDLIRIHRQVFGVFPREIGLQTSFFQPSIGVDTKIIFLGRWGFNLGILGSGAFDFYVSPTATISYRLDRISWIHNTEVWAGWVPLAHVPYQIGLRINL